VGKVWQLTACDAACSYTLAQVVPAATPMRWPASCDVVQPTYDGAGWRVQRSDDGGVELGRVSGGVVWSGHPAHAISQATPGRMASWNGCRARFCTNIGAWCFAALLHQLVTLQRSLESFVHFYNHDARIRVQAPWAHARDAFWAPRGRLTR